MELTLAAATTGRLRDALDDAPFDCLVLGHPANVAYATGYRSLAGDIMHGHRMAAFVGPGAGAVVGPVADAAAAAEAGLDGDRYVPYGRFFFESTDGSHDVAGMSDRNAGFDVAFAEATRRSQPRGRVGVDDGIDPGCRQVLAGLPGVTAIEDAASWALEVRAVKTEPELERMAVAAAVTEQGIDAALAHAGPGVTEQELASVVAGSMTAGGGQPRFLVVTTGPRSALSDARATDRAWQPGELCRFDVGCTVDGYWSDLARTAVLGEPSPEASARYDAILAGELAQLDAAAPGLTAGELFDVAVDVVEAEGLSPYRRHHCGHAIGSEVYERPIIAPGVDTPLQPGMVFCIETPYYELGWGGMMVEDTIVITADGNRRLSSIDRSLRRVAA